LGWIRLVDHNGRQRDFVDQTTELTVTEIGVVAAARPRIVRKVEVNPADDHFLERDGPINDLAITVEDYLSRISVEGANVNAARGGTGEGDLDVGGARRCRPVEPQDRARNVAIADFDAVRATPRTGGCRVNSILAGRKRTGAKSTRDRIERDRRAAGRPFEHD